MDWLYISEHESLTESFIEENAMRLDWKAISKFQTLSEEFIKKHMKVVNMDLILQNQTLSLGFIETYKHLNNFWYHLSFNPHLTEDILETFSENWHWDMLVFFVPLSEPFIEKYQNKIKRMDWHNLVRKQKLSLSFLQKYEKRINFTMLSLNQHITDDVLAYYESKLGWHFLSESVPLSFETVQTFIHRIDLELLKSNEHISFTTKQWDHLQKTKRFCVNK